MRAPLSRGTCILLRPLMVEERMEPTENVVRVSTLLLTSSSSEGRTVRREVERERP